MKKLYFLIAAVLAATGLCAQAQDPVALSQLIEPGVSAPVLERQVKSDALAEGEPQVVSPAPRIELALKPATTKGKIAAKAPSSSRKHVARALR